MAPSHALLLVLLGSVVASCSAASTATSSVAAGTAAAQADRITDLPGLETPLGFNMYGGYLDVDPAHGRALYYWFFESQSMYSQLPFTHMNTCACSLTHKNARVMLAAVRRAIH